MVKDSVRKNDSMKYGTLTPEWKTVGEGEAGLPRASNMPSAMRPQHLGTFIVDVLSYEAKKVTDKWKAELDKKFNGVQNREDLTLSGPFREYARKLVRGDWVHFRNDLEHMFNVISSLHAECSKRGPSFTKKPIEERQDILRADSLRFATTPDPIHMTKEEAARVKASLAYFYDCHGDLRGRSFESLIMAASGEGKGCRVKWSRFPWDVAFQELCAIKAKSSPASRSISKTYLDKMVISKKFLR